jgi:hypothetical protein
MWPFSCAAQYGVLPCEFQQSFDERRKPHRKGPLDLRQRPLNMGQRSDVPLPEVAFMP